ncbi:pantoate--beta-alanine ligase [Devriesea agamarum]|uniref:pantoate--beta-alanine ligase n=1 Tax=Devriesea agamarum TaxID=472569 RepID=UPI00071C41D7|nr:pantoate--beta-alanine ligase [Devriesea agamarum]
MICVNTCKDVRLARRKLTGALAFVPTMGALHDGHLSLVRRAREIADHVAVSIFVNPLQFGPGEDYERYPRDLDADLAMLREAGGVDLVFSPTVDEMYPQLPPMVSVTTGDMGTVWEGEKRPGHFDGVATVVTKLFTLVAPDIAVFGQKDAQQLAIIRRMVADLNLPVEIEAAPIQRDVDGLALSSRNAYLSPQERERALVLPALIEVVEQAGPSLGGVRRAVEDHVRRSADQVDWDYAAALDPLTMREAGRDDRGEILVMIAARVGSTRLLDNTVVRIDRA